MVLDTASATDDTRAESHIATAEAKLEIADQSEGRFTLRREDSPSARAGGNALGILRLEQRESREDARAELIVLIRATSPRKRGAGSDLTCLMRLTERDPWKKDQRGDTP